MHTRIMYRSERIKVLREARGLTQGQLATQAGTTQATISRIEKGEGQKRPDRALAQHIARALKVALMEVFEDAQIEPDTEPQSDTPSVDTELETSLLRAIDLGRHTIADLEAALRGLQEAMKMTGEKPDPEAVARRWLDAASSLRVSGIPPTPSALAAHIALKRSAPRLDAA
jgi:transcriptional regulator with XRE-family HTH domain